MNKILFFSFLLFFCVVNTAQAQRCETDYELIFEMDDPEIGSYNVWDTVYGKQKKQERFRSGVVIKNDHTVVTGERFVYEGGDIELLITEIDRRGRTVWEKSHKIKGLAQVKKILSDGEGYLVLGYYTPEKGNGQAWVGFFDAKGALLRQKKISHPQGPLIPEDIIRDHDDKNLVMVASRKHGRQNIYNALFYRLSSKGNVLWDRAYMPGLDNRVYAIALSHEGQYIATGHLRGDDGRKNGWIVQVNDDGRIAWQRQYARGRSARINAAVDFDEHYKIVAGTAHPFGPDTTAAWVMMVDSANGNIIWQRYYKGGVHYQGRDLLLSRDGVFTLLVNGEKDTDEETEYTRLLTINPRGVLLISDEYFNSKGAQGYQLLQGPVGDRIIVGATDMAFQIEKEGEEPETGQSKDGWLISTPAMEVYRDPCVKPYSFLP